MSDTRQIPSSSFMSSHQHSLPLNTPPGWRILVNGLPKSGTHLAKKVLQLCGMPGNPLTLAAYHADQAIVTWNAEFEPVLGPAVEIGALQVKPIHELLLRQLLRSIPPQKAFNGHCAYSVRLANLLKQEQVKVVNLVRDPRDVIVSLAEYLKKHHHPQYRDKSWNKCLSQAISGYAPLHQTKVEALRILDWGQAWQAFIPWLEDSENSLSLRFEDLIGPEGGGSLETQLDAVSRLASFAGNSELDARTIRDRIFGGTRTFHKGTTGRWREKFTDHHKALFKEVCGTSLMDLGYEDNDDW